MAQRQQTNSERGTSTPTLLPPIQPARGANPEGAKCPSTFYGTFLSTEYLVPTARCTLGFAVSWYALQGERFLGQCMVLFRTLLEGRRTQSRVFLREHSVLQAEDSGVLVGTVLRAMAYRSWRTHSATEIDGSENTVNLQYAHSTTRHFCVSFLERAQCQHLKDTGAPSWQDTLSPGLTIGESGRRADPAADDGRHGLRTRCLLVEVLRWAAE